MSVTTKKPEQDDLALPRYEAIIDRPRSPVQGKMAIAALTESVRRWICRGIGGGTFFQFSPFGH